MLALDDGSYVLSGYTYPLGGDDSNIRRLLVGIRTDGDILWTIYCDDRGEVTDSTQPAPCQGGFGDADYFAGTRFLNKQNKRWGYPEHNWLTVEKPCVLRQAMAIERTSDRGWLIGGEEVNVPRPGTFDRRDLLALKTDSTGNEIWTIVLSCGQWGGFNRVRAMPDGGCIIAGQISSDQSYKDRDVYVVRLDSQGDTVWTWQEGAAGWDAPKDLALLADGGCMVLALMQSATEFLPVHLFRLDRDGKIVWNHSYAKNKDVWPECLVQTRDGGFLIAGTWHNGTGPNRDQMMLIRTDALGNQLWAQDYGTWHNDMAYEAAELDDGGYLVAGMWHGGYGIIRLRPDSSSRK